MSSLIATGFPTLIAGCLFVSNSAEFAWINNDLPRWLPRWFGGLCIVIGFTATAAGLAGID